MKKIILFAITIISILSISSVYAGYSLKNYTGEEVKQIYQNYCETYEKDFSNYKYYIVTRFNDTTYGTGTLIYLFSNEEFIIDENDEQRLKPNINNAEGFAYQEPMGYGRLIKDSESINYENNKNYWTTMKYYKNYYKTYYSNNSKIVQQQEDDFFPETPEISGEIPEIVQQLQEMSVEKMQVGQTMKTIVIVAIGCLIFLMLSAILPKVLRIFLK